MATRRASRTGWNRVWLLGLPVLLALACVSLPAQAPQEKQGKQGQQALSPAEAAHLEAQAAKLRQLVAEAPQLAVEKIDIKLQPPSPGWEIGYPSSVTMDANGDIYILQRGTNADPVIVVNREGKVLRSWGKGMYTIPHAIRMGPDGNIWTTDSASSMILEFTPEGKKIFEIAVGGQPEGKRPPNGTTDVAFGPNGHVYVSDGYGNARVLEYTSEGNLVRQWGSAGMGPGQFVQPHGIAVDPDGIIYVADRRNGRLQRFDPNGRYLGEFDDLGMVTSVAFVHGELWIGTQQRNESTQSDGWIMKIDRRTGEILGLIDSAHGQHVVNVTMNGDVLAGGYPLTPLWFRPIHSASR